jgi:hypothetical protein
LQYCCTAAALAWHLRAATCTGVDNRHHRPGGRAAKAYGDALHLTSQGFAIVGQYVARQLAAPLTLQAPSDLGLGHGAAMGTDAVEPA